MTFLLLLTLPAFADAVGPDPEDCPAGSIGTSSHAGEWCTPLDCDAGCDEGSCAEDVGLCVVNEEVGCGGFQPDTAEPCTFERHRVTGTCDSNADCDEGSCEIADRCVDGPLNGACAAGCSSTSTGSVALGIVLLLLGGILGRRSGA